MIICKRGSFSFRVRRHFQPLLLNKAKYPHNVCEAAVALDVSPGQQRCGITSFCVYKSLSCAVRVSICWWSRRFHVCQPSSVCSHLTGVSMMLCFLFWMNPISQKSKMCPNLHFLQLDKSHRCWRLNQKPTVCRTSLDNLSPVACSRTFGEEDAVEAARHHGWCPPPPHDALLKHSSTFSRRLIPPKCTTGSPSFLQLDLTTPPLMWDTFYGGSPASLHYLFNLV